ncbi:MAG: prenyltransferase/squalene oxidase repeat-containing protein [Planctomycetota bacterium]|jgi:hypothetical protein
MTELAQQPRKRTDWRTPILLTLSVHMLAFTLFINHRMLMLFDEITPEEFVLTGKLAETSEAEIDKPDDSGAAAGQPAENVAKAPAISEVLPQDQPTKPLPARDTSKNKPAETNTNSTPLGDHLSTEASSHTGVAVGDSPGGGALGFRGQGSHGIGLSKNGGSQATENAVGLGLHWLAKVQDIDGKWDSDAFMMHYLRNPSSDERYQEGPGYMRNDIGLTGLCLLAFSGAGHKPDVGDYGSTTRRARDYLISQQRPEDGGFGHRGTTASETMYAHSIATLALTDLYLLTGNAKLRPKLKRALLYMLSMQSATGGWDYKQRSPRNSERFKFSKRDDMSISGWAILALVAAREANFDVPEDNLKRVVAFLKAYTEDNGEVIYANRTPRAGHRGPGVLAVGNIGRVLMGESPKSAMQKKQRGMIAKDPPEWETEGTNEGNMYSWYYGSLAMLLGKDQTDGERNWRDWNIGLKRTLLENQCKSGPRKGSFDPVHHWGEHGGGRVYSTAMGVLCLEIYYRYRPEFLRAEARDLNKYWK